jgi:SPFH domain / Band 7 family
MLLRLVFFSFSFSSSSSCIHISHHVLTPLPSLPPLPPSPPFPPPSPSLPQLYGQGRYLVGLGKEFLKFPSTWLTLNFGRMFATPHSNTIAARSNDGLIIEIDLSFQYRLVPTVEGLISLYYDFGFEWEAGFVAITRATVRDVAAEYKAFDFFTKRSTITSAMQVALANRLVGLNAEVTALQIVNLEINSQFADAITETQTAAQDIQQAENEKRVEIVDAAKVVEVARNVANVTIILAKTEAEATLAKANADATILKRRVFDQTQSLLSLKSKNGYSNTELLSYEWLLTARENSATSTIMGWELPAAISP